MSGLSFTERLNANRTVCVVLVRGSDDKGGRMYAYVGVRADAMDAFMRAQALGNFYPERFGVVIASGSGEPDDEVRARMERDYGFNHAGMVDIPDAASLTGDTQVRAAVFGKALRPAPHEAEPDSEQTG